jgi:hypothetical protein
MVSSARYLAFCEFVFLAVGLLNVYHFFENIKRRPGNIGLDVAVIRLLVSQKYPVIKMDRIIDIILKFTVVWVLVRILFGAFNFSTVGSRYR